MFGGKSRPALCRHGNDARGAGVCEHGAFGRIVAPIPQPSLMGWTGGPFLLIEV